MSLVSPSQSSPGEEIKASKINTPINQLAAVINGGLDDSNISSLSGNKISANTLDGDAFDANLRGGWLAGILPAPNTVTYNGNRSYDLVFNNTDLTDEVSPGMRLRFTRTATAPTQCTDLESGSTQYWSRASGLVSGISFTDDFTTMAWVKLESYTGALQGILARSGAGVNGFRFEINSSGQLQIVSLNSAGNNRTIASQQSIPLNRWVHVAASMDNSGGNYAVYIDGVLVPSSTSTTGTITAIVQSGDLMVGNITGAANPFDGKIAQVGLFDAVLTAATIRSYASQTLSGSEANCVGAWLFNGNGNDADSNANTLTAQGSATATNADSPFSLGADLVSGYTDGTTDFGIVMAATFSTNTTLTVQVPEGCTIPTSGGISSMAYSAQDGPYGFPKEKNRWAIRLVCRVQAQSASATSYTNTGSLKLSVPVGVYDLSYMGKFQKNPSSATSSVIFATLSTANNSESDNEFTATIEHTGTTANVNSNASTAGRSKTVRLTTQTDYFLNIRSDNTNGTLYIRGEEVATVINAENELL